MVVVIASTVLTVNMVLTVTGEMVQILQYRALDALGALYLQRGVGNVELFRQHDLNLAQHPRLPPLVIRQNVDMCR
jgi:hypothetical protein